MTDSPAFGKPGKKCYFPLNTMQNKPITLSQFNNKITKMKVLPKYRFPSVKMEINLRFSRS